MAPNGFMEDVKQPNYMPYDKPDNRNKETEGQQSARQPLKIPSIIGITTIHLVALYALFFSAIHAKFYTFVFCTMYGCTSGFGVTAGAHRLWAHKTYKARLPLQLFLLTCFSAAGQNTLPQWVLDHRVHHKFSETHADPHNSNRGFFFAHVGWLMQRKHPQVLSKGKLVDISDILNDPVVRFHTKYFTQFKLFFCFIVPMALPCVLWGEDLTISILGNILRYCIGLNATWLVNSAAHIYGNRPFSTQIRPAENVLVSLVTLGEGWHNYHHVFPWDYKAAEMGHIVFNLTTVILDLCAAVGLAYDLKSPSKELVEKVARRYGDGSRYAGKEHHHHPREIGEDGKEVHEEEVEKSFHKSCSSGDQPKIATSLAQDL